MPDLSFLGPSAASVIIVLGFLKFLSTIGKELISALKELTDSNKKIANATNKAAKEAKQRNGHLGEQNIKIIQTVLDGNKAIVEGLSELKEGDHVVQKTSRRSNITKIR
jgi:hypothetical protein